MALFTVFKSHILSCKYVFTDGTEAAFVNGRYMTDDEDRISELQKEITNKHPLIYVDDKEKTVDSTELDPMSALRAKIRAEELEKIKEELARDMGTTGDSKAKTLGVTTSANVSKAMADSLSIPGTK